MPGQALQLLRRLLEGQFGAGRGYPRLQLSTQDLVGAQAEHLVGRDPAPLTRRAPVVRAFEGGSRRTHSPAAGSATGVAGDGRHTLDRPRVVAGRPGDPAPAPVR